jgi:hypothetical protein
MERDVTPLIQRLREDAETYRMIAKFSGVPDTTLGRALLAAADHYTNAADVMELQWNRIRTLQDENALLRSEHQPISESVVKRDEEGTSVTGTIS